MQKKATVTNIKGSFTRCSLMLLLSVPWGTLAAHHVAQGVCFAILMLTSGPAAPGNEVALQRAAVRPLPLQAGPLPAEGVCGHHRAQPLRPQRRQVSPGDIRCPLSRPADSLHPGSQTANSWCVCEDSRELRLLTPKIKGSAQQQAGTLTTTLLYSNTLQSIYLTNVFIQSNAYFE